MEPDGTGKMNWSLQRKKLNKMRFTCGRHERLSLGVDSTLLCCGTYHWTKLARVGEAIGHRVNLALNMSVCNNLLHRHIASLQPRLIYDHRNYLMSLKSRAIIHI